jgi:hypothetical protein
MSVHDALTSSGGRNAPAATSRTNASAGSRDGAGTGRITSLPVALGSTTTARICSIAETHFSPIRHSIAEETTQHEGARVAGCAREENARRLTGRGRRSIIVDPREQESSRSYPPLDLYVSRDRISRGKSSTHRRLVTHLTVTITLRSRGPSNSTSMTTCQMPSASRPFWTGMVSLGPKIAALR